MKNKVMIVLMIIVLILMVIIGFAYARYTKVMTGNAETEVAKPICTWSVDQIEDASKINSYCNVTVKNYDGDDISEVGMQYEIKVRSNDGSEIPEYYWLDENGNNIGTTLTGTFSHTTKQQNIHKICFVNSGNMDITKSIRFDLNAIQLSN